MTKKTVLITGALGEMGHSLITHLKTKNDKDILAFDLKDPFHAIAGVEYIKGSVTDKELISSISLKHNIDTIYHLAAILSTGGEKDPLIAHQVNVEGSLNILNLAKAVGEKQGHPVKVIFPSTIAVYGISTPEEKKSLGKVAEDTALNPITMYGMNKLYVEHLGKYFDSYFSFLNNPTAGQYVDFRVIRYPGILSAETVPTGGTSDYGPEMLHSAAQGLNYKCFVNPDTRIPFMVMPDAVKALTLISESPRQNLSTYIYNVTAFAPSALEIETEIKKYFPNFTVSYEPHIQRLKIVESWPADTNDSKAAKDWGWRPDYDFTKAFAEYLVPAVRARYNSQQAMCA